MAGRRVGSGDAMVRLNVYDLSPYNGYGYWRVRAV